MIIEIYEAILLDPQYSMTGESTNCPSSARLEFEPKHVFLPEKSAR